jgi:hypothetical protein
MLSEEEAKILPERLRFSVGGNNHQDRGLGLTPDLGQQIGSRTSYQAIDPCFPFVFEYPSGQRVDQLTGFLDGVFLDAVHVLKSKSISGIRQPIGPKLPSAMGTLWDGWKTVQRRQTLFMSVVRCASSVGPKFESANSGRTEEEVQDI